MMRLVRNRFAAASATHAPKVTAKPMMCSNTTTLRSSSMARAYGSASRGWRGFTDAVIPVATPSPGGGPGGRRVRWWTSRRRCAS